MACPRAKKSFRPLSLFLLLAGLSSCASVKEGVFPSAPSESSCFEEAPLKDEAEEKEEGEGLALAEARAAVEELDAITREKDYSRWLSYLDGAYRDALSMPECLKEVSAILKERLNDRNVQLLTLEDYFELVFVPSRQNARVDVIHLASAESAWALMSLPRGRQVAVYILKRDEAGCWKLSGNAPCGF